jgi:chaperone modulatory protein CbpM
MIRPIQMVAAEFGVAVEQLTIWVDRRWLRPSGRGQDLAFDDADLARLRMIVDFRRDLAIDDETMPVVLDLLDRLHATRTRLRSVLQAVAEMPEAAQAVIVSRIAGETDP